MEKQNNHKWSFCSVGGVVRVKIDSGEDIAHLGELDQKLWTVLSCPVKGLAFDETTLGLLDSDSDGVIRVNEVVAASKWLTSAVKSGDSILDGKDFIRLDNINTDNPTGKALYDSACRILSNLGKPDAEQISVSDTSDGVAIFAKTLFNGDGIITEATAGDDVALKETVSKIISSVGSSVDRSGAAGVTADHIESFYTALSDYSEWQAAGESDKDNVFPFGAKTAEAFSSCEALKDKIADFFMRCKLVQFDADASAAVDVSVEKISAISGENLSNKSELIATYPLARPNMAAVLPMIGINPAWQASFSLMKSLVLPECEDGINEEQWNDILEKFVPYTAWLSSKKGCAVEPLGIESVNAILKENRKAELLALVEKDKAVAAEATNIDQVDKLTHLYRDFYKFLKNYVVFEDFYNVNSSERAVFEAGELYVDQRCCKLCVKVEDLGRHADMAGLSGMFLIYCKCVSRTKGETMDIVAVMTAGGIKNLRPGKNAIFYDRSGQDWDATITKIVDNPINVRTAFWSPYRKFWEFCVGIINKSATEKESKATSDLQKAASDTVAKPGDISVKSQAFDIAKFAGIFAALGMGLGMLADALVGVAQGVAKLEWWQLLCVIAAIILIISGPSCFIAWTKLRKRNLGPVLNANGWAINSVLLVNTMFGATLTKVAKYPRLKLDDPFAPKVPVWKKVVRWIFVLAILTFGVLYFTDRLNFLGIHRHKAQEEITEAVVAEDVAVEEQPVADTPAIE